MNFDVVSQWLAAHKQPIFRRQQLLQAINNGAGEWSQVSSWPRSLREQIAQELPFVSFQASQVLISHDGTQKAALTLLDGHTIETVCMRPKPDQVSICVSSQVGCPMNCAFCATGKMGFTRSLTSEEITDQWLFWLISSHQHQTQRPGHVVFMGMGEPFHNLSAVLGSIHSLHENYGLGWRKISVSTSGLVEGINTLATMFPQVNLAISLHSAINTKRTSLMPVNRASDLDDLKIAINAYCKLTKRQVMFEYLLLSEVNDTPADLRALITYLGSFPKNLAHVNLIRYNPTGSFVAPTQKKLEEWKQGLIRAGISVSIRKNLGTDICGACGQLATKRNPTLL